MPPKNNSTEKETALLTLYHSPRTRSTRIVALLEELGARDKVKIEPVEIARPDGTGAHDPNNPHPEGRVPYLVHDDTGIWESTAIALYLTELFPEAGLGRAPGTPDRGALLSWLAWYGDVLEPMMIFSFSGVESPVIERAFGGIGGIAARLATALETGPYLLGADYTIADMMIASAFTFAPQITPDDKNIRDWVARCAARPSAVFAQDYDENLRPSA
jgi:glutathione S-transferase